MSIDKTIKNKVIGDWQHAFPQLSMYSQNKLYKVIGPLITGLELIKLPRTEEYRPYFVVYSLWGGKMGTDIKASLSGPIILMEFYNKKNLQYNIPYEKHDIFFNEVLDSVKKQTPISFSENISLKKMLSVLDEYSKTPPLSVAPNSYLQAALYEAKLKISLYISNVDANAVLQEIQKKDWDLNHFKACGIDVSNWILQLYESITSRDEFLRQIEINKKDKKILKLHISELTM